jgi:carbon monoxide dehydrogenase subunit G
MGEHRGRIAVAKPAGEVFAFLADPHNLPRWQPAFREAFREGPDRIRAIGNGLGAKGVAAHLRFVADAGGHRLSWAAEVGVGCAGDLAVQAREGGSEVELTLRLGERAEKREALAGFTGDPALDMAAALQASLVAIKQVCEDHRGGVTLVSGGTQAHPDQAPLRDSRPYGTSATENPTTS